jgi:AcrR family transcriptional regulator
MILEAAERLFIELGYGATSLQQIADEAGVAVQTIYALFGRKQTLLAELLDVTIAGDDEPVAVNDREWMSAVFTDPDPAVRLRAYAAAVTRIYQRAGDLFGALQAAAETDPGLVPLAVQTEQRRRTGAASVVDSLSELGALRSDLDNDRAVDLMWALNSPDFYRRLVRDCGWAPSEYESWLATIMIRSLVDDGHD